MYVSTISEFTSTPLINGSFSGSRFSVHYFVDLFAVKFFFLFLSFFLQNVNLQASRVCALFPFDIIKIINFMIYCFALHTCTCIHFGLGLAGLSVSLLHFSFILFVSVFVILNRCHSLLIVHCCVPSNVHTSELHAADVSFFLLQSTFVWVTI